jgi:hypothetical protein
VASCRRRKQLRRAGERLVGPHGGWKGVGANLAGDKGEDLAALVVDPEEARGTIESLRLEVAEEALHSLAPRMEGAADRVADADDRREISAGERRFFLLHTPSIYDLGRAFR